MCVSRTIEQVYEDPIFQALNPEGKEFLRARMLPSSLNPFKCSIQMTALLAFGELPHIKAVAVVQMMLEDFKKGIYEDKHTVVVDSSGNTAYVVTRLARAFGFEHVKVVLPSDVPASKKALFSALSTPEVILVPKGMSAADRAEEEAWKPGHCRINQYAHMGNVRAHSRYTGPEIMRALGGRAIGAIAIPMGSGGTACGVGRYLKEKNRETIIVGIRPALGEQVPGARDKKKMEEVVTLPWEKVVDEVIEVSRKESFTRMRQLGSWIEPQPGPTSGLAYAGLVQFIRFKDFIERKQIDTVAFVCPDSAMLYSDVTIAELDTGQGLCL